MFFTRRNTRITVLIVLIVLIALIVLIVVLLWNVLAGLMGFDCTKNWNGYLWGFLKSSNSGSAVRNTARIDAKQRAARVFGGCNISWSTWVNPTLAPPFLS